MEPLIVLSTFPNTDTARHIATALVEERLAACVNLCPAVQSIYRWQGQVESAEEVLAIIKTTRSAYGALEERLKTLHPYDVPEIIALPVERGLESYVKWLGESVCAPLESSHQAVSDR
jgi:periplasmic divalent cation tolerance protein